MNKKIILYLIAVLLLIGIGGYFFPSFVQVTQIHTNTDHTVSAEDLAKVKSLFQKNNIDMGTLAIEAVVVDERGEIHVRASQFYKNLPIDDILYHFHSSGKAFDRLYIDGTEGIYTSGDRVGDLGISIEPTISAYTAARKAREEMKSNYFFTAELGFYDSTAGTSYTEPNWLLVWRVKPKGVNEYPYAIIDANNGKLIYYWNGIIVN